MTADLARLRAAFPAFSIGIHPGWRGLTFEAWRNPPGDGLYAVITPDADELWRELYASRAREGSQRTAPSRPGRRTRNTTPPAWRMDDDRQT